MAWIVLIISGMFEAVWAVALSKSEGFTRLVPSLVFLAGLTVSMGGLALAMRTLPAGTSYAVWVAIGAVLTIGYSMATGDESISPVKIALLLGLITCVVGLKLAH
ncbi:multidrug efflux SMR transporter [Saccharopolyspora sp. TS4A08]|uniref:Multidrug efflux SMR transporter n=1 Tax=Saccharopolyspora ipomoeae TaxID=3042027 RepID=A0ABT6PIT3_9PSEU|nr:multidrug efflux SMR transporter [Saccharopolyspora sp. TS4A08]MDI2027912.1 multidrug efflux SMR transporter [Saccharopolyspora sp. TS4A08]